MRGNSETGITFRTFGGHSHNGENSSKVDFSTYTDSDLVILRNKLNITDTVFIPPKVENYTPTWSAATTSPTLGNGTLAGTYLATSRYIRFRIYLKFGSTTSAGSGTYGFSLPNGVAVSSGIAQTVGGALAYDSSASAYHRGMAFVPDNDLAIIRILFADNTATTWSNTVPFTWATSDFISVEGLVEI